MNTMFQEYKKQTDEYTVVFVDELDVPFEIKAMDFSIDERGKFNRAKEKGKTKKIIDEYYDQEK